MDLESICQAVDTPSFCSLTVGREEGERGVVRRYRLADVRMVKVVATTPIARRGERNQSVEVEQCPSET